MGPTGKKGLTGPIRRGVRVRVEQYSGPSGAVHGSEWRGTRPNGNVAQRSELKGHMGPTGRKRLKGPIRRGAWVRVEQYTGPSGGAHGSEWKEVPPGTESEGHTCPSGGAHGSEWRGTRA
ncbi:hypothetical protein Y032_0761g2129 [Ancylostoma ceylanicum]|uniref:Uncharacterized protein n=1 Tax=Ancylostoma ceylanicum TaxID=53326 RepID=A0A016WEY5_9BILA|nr:hypothetical protein Y032_0761g2129 [Ancylostoma ceylanicum]